MREDEKVSFSTTNGPGSGPGGASGAATSNKNKNFVDNMVSFDAKETNRLVDMIRHFEKLQR